MLLITCSFSPFHVFSSRPLVKMSITWRKGGVVVNTGIRDFGRRLVISLPTVSDSGHYECEVSLRGSSVPSVTAGAFLHVLGKQPTAAESKLSEYYIGLLPPMLREHFAVIYLGNRVHVT